MAIELHHLNTHGMMEQAGNVLDGVSKLKERIAELEQNLSEIQSQKMQLEDDVALLRRNNAELKEAQRWRKFSEEKPEHNGIYIVLLGEHTRTLDVYDTDKGKFRTFMPTAWMPLPSAPKEL